MTCVYGVVCLSTATSVKIFRLNDTHFVVTIIFLSTVKDVLASLLASKNGDDVDGGTKSALTRLKFSLRGRALAGHRGGKK